MCSKVGEKEMNVISLISRYNLPNIICNLLMLCKPPMLFLGTIGRKLQKYRSQREGKSFILGGGGGFWCTVSLPLSEEFICRHRWTNIGSITESDDPDNLNGVLEHKLAWRSDSE